MSEEDGFIPAGVSLLASIAAVAVIRSAYLYDVRYQENLGHGWTTALAVVGLVLAVLALARAHHRRIVMWARAAAGIAVASLGFVLWVSSHDGGCVAGCGPF